MLTVDVNNIMAQLSLVEIDADYDTSQLVDDYNPDCFVLVYAVDDRESFGESWHVLERENILSDFTFSSSK